MKYAKELDNKLKSYSFLIKLTCISYRKWKKKKKLNNDWIRELYYDCVKAELAPKELYETNMKTLFKICKRLEKKFNVEAKQYYNKLVRTNLFKFTANARETLI